jgi:UDP-2,3-diacylglucosamine pyrophosphatase LpxH
MQAADRYGALYVISDLHIGGPPGYQIFDQGSELAWLLRHVASQSGAADEPVGLVLNGDVVDFLAADGAKYLDPDGAPAKLQQIFDDPAFQPVWRDLGQLLEKPFHRVIVAVGNHDPELALPAVQALLRDRLCGNDDSKRGRLVFSTDGTGYAASVGGRRVLCVHGNEVDPWNVVDHDALRGLVQAMNASRPLPDWTPNAGTTLVIDVMNAVKRRWPMVDLLKPEGGALVAVLAALDPSQLKRLRDLGPTLVRLARQAVGSALGILADAPAPRGGRAADVDPDTALSALLRMGAAPPPGAAPLAARGGISLLAEAGALLEQGRQPFDLAAGTPGRETLGVGGMIADLFTRRSPAENLRESLAKWLAWDTTFSFATEDDTYERLDREIGPEVDFLLAGHTHLERALERKRGTGVYFNTGTWARLIQLLPDVLSDGKKFETVFATFQKGTMQALDAHPDLVLRRATVAAVMRDANGRAYGELSRVEPLTPARQDFALRPVARTRLSPVA